MAATADEILERRREEDEVLLAAQRRREAEAARAWREHCESLPRLAYDPRGAIKETRDAEPGVLYVMATARAEAFDGRRVWVAASPGDWIEESRARLLGLDGPAVALAADAAKKDGGRPPRR